LERVAIDVEAGRQTGFACCVLLSAEMARRALAELDRREIQGRWIGV
jgi:hypothetical protein